MKNEKYTKLFYILSAIYITCSLASNIMAVKLINIGGTTLTGAVLIFPITYILGDIFTEVYGFKKTKTIIWTGFICNALMIGLLTITIYMPYPESWTGQTAFEETLGTTPRIFSAGLIAYFFGSILNAMILSKLKVKTKGRFLWLRTILSTIVGEGVDSIIFVCIVFIGVLSINQLVLMILSQFIWKTCYEIIFTPVTYLVVRKVKAYDNVDIYDTDNKYTLI